MYFATDTDRIVKGAVSMIRSGKTDQAAALLATIKDGALIVDDEHIVQCAGQAGSVYEQIAVVRDKLKTRRIELDLSVDDVARKTGLSRSAVYVA